MDLQQTRPTVHLRRRRVARDRLARDHAHRGPPRPRRRARHRARAVAAVARRARRARRRRAATRRVARRSPSAASRRWRRTVVRSACSPPAPTRSLVGARRGVAQDYAGPTGAQSVLQVMLGEAGIPTVATVGPGTALPRGWRVAAGDPRPARAPPRARRASSRPRRPRRARRVPTCSGSRRVSPTAPTSPRSSSAIEAGEDEVDEADCRVATTRVRDRALPARPVTPCRTTGEQTERAGAGSAQPATNESTPAVSGER